MRRLCALCLVVFAVVGITQAAGASAASTEKVDLSLDFAIDGLHAPFFVAKQLGYYKEAGLDVSIHPGQGSADTVKVTGAGRSQFGFADAATMGKGVSEGAKVKMIALVLRKSPAVVVVRKDSGITTPAGLKGKSVGDFQLSSTATLLPAFLAANGIKKDDVRFIGMPFQSRVPSLLRGNVDAILGYIQEFVNIQSQTRFLQWAKHGIKAYGSGVIVNDAWAQSHPEETAAFAKATMRGLRYTLAHPAEAAAIVAAASHGDKKYFAGELALLKPLFAEAGPTGGLGSMTTAGWKTTENMMLRYGGQTKQVPVASLFTNAYLGG
jgi:NitT/TauT family transport system substrate-binding protein